MQHDIPGVQAAHPVMVIADASPLNAALSLLESIEPLILVHPLVDAGVIGQRRSSRTRNMSQLGN